VTRCCNLRDTPPLPFVLEEILPHERVGGSNCSPSLNSPKPPGTERLSSPLGTPHVWPAAPQESKIHTTAFGSGSVPLVRQSPAHTMLWTPSSLIRRSTGSACPEMSSGNPSPGCSERENCPYLRYGRLLVGGASDLSPHHARITCYDREYGGPSLRAVGFVRRNAVGAASSRDRMARGRVICSTKAHSRIIDSIAASPAL